VFLCSSRISMRPLCSLSLSLSQILLLEIVLLTIIGKQRPELLDAAKVEGCICFTYSFVLKGMISLTHLVF
jgi:hypothetical protein